ncbi:phytanoyl-CoA dioxygenase family protein [Algoriphagus aquimarinus]|uniref:phytanoyl-CoA dioxygenase family protein n=1 Tax=Algoriphagus aquimarinus TaxID=237018 RepID=UPI0030D9B138|tara:strand:+ start:120932 stop:121738 length:807 start_codon:yes stop_codon:yes gene_type:complete
MNNLAQHYPISPEAKAFYQENNYIKLKQVLSPEEVAHFNEVISAEVQRKNTQERPMEERDTYSKAFLQIFNLWTESEEVKKLVMSQRLAQIASDLMGCEHVRIYHDQALFKEAGGGITPWHADQYYWPIDTNNTITAWIPLQATPLEMGPLEFSAKSQQIVFGRDLQIGDDSEVQIKQNLRVNNFEHVIEAFDLGEVSFHSGWVFHRAGANQTDQMRKVMTIIYMDAEAKLMNPKNDNQIHDWNTWCPGAKIGELIDTELNPVAGDLI